MNGQNITLEIEASGTESQIQFYKNGSIEGQGVLDLTGSNLLTGLIAPTNASDAATKAYVDALGGEGVTPVAPVAAASTGNLTLSGTQTIDGVEVTAGQRVLAKNQTTASQNGIYTVAAGAWTKVAADSVQGVLVFVEEGAVNNDSKFYATDATTWILFSRTDTITASTGLTKVGTDIRVATGGITNAMLAGSIDPGKISDFAANAAVSAESTWGNGTNAFSTSVHINQIASLLGRIKGTYTNLTDNPAITLSDAAAKNRTFVVTADPANTGFVSGDVALQTVV
jgi:hypothetical protein